MAINNNDSIWNASFSTSLPDGQYCDVISGTGLPPSCTGTTCVLSCSFLFFPDVKTMYTFHSFSITVSQGSFTGSVPPRNAIAIHTAATTGNKSGAAAIFKQVGSMGYMVSILVVVFLQSLLLVFY